MNGSTKMRRSVTVAFLLMLMLIPVGCGDDADDGVETATIAPATPEPNVDLEDDPALTQTVEPGENRSPYEGGPLEDDQVVGGDTTDEELPRRD